MFMIRIFPRQPVSAALTLEAFRSAVNELPDGWRVYSTNKIKAYDGIEMNETTISIGISAGITKERIHKRFLFFGSQTILEWKLKIQIDPMDTTQKFEKVCVQADFSSYLRGFAWLDWKPEDLEQFDAMPILKRFLERFEQIMNELCFCQL